MRRVIAVSILVAVMVGCHAAVPPEVLRQWQGRTLYTCCNIHYESNTVNDANYFVGTTLPFGSPVTVTAMTSDSATVRSGSTDLTIVHSYGRDQESAQQYFSKILVDTDPHVRFATFPKDVQSAITDGRVERGMTKEQVIMSLGYPPTHRTASTNLNTWTYWYNHWVTYTVTFDDSGKVANIVGTAPTNNQPILEPTPIPAAPVHKIRGKSK
jgi:hypothetical protein